MSAVFSDWHVFLLTAACVWLNQDKIYRALIKTVVACASNLIFFAEKAKGSKTSSSKDTQKKSVIKLRKATLKKHVATPFLHHLNYKYVNLIYRMDVALMPSTYE